MARILIILISILQLIGVGLYWLNIELDIKFRFDSQQTDYVQESGIRITIMSDIFCTALVVFSMLLLFVGIYYKTKTK